MNVPTHRARHRATGADKTTLLPRIAAEPEAERTTVLPVISVAAEPAPQLVAATLPASPPGQAGPGPRSGSGPVLEADPGHTVVLPIVVPEQARAGDPPAPVPESTPVTDPAPARRRSVGDVVRLVSRSAGELLLTFGLVVLLLAAYELWGKSALINSHQNDLDNQLAQQWGNPAAGASPNVPAGPPPPGGTIGRLYIPKLKLHWVVVEGVALSDIRYAPGHYPGTAMPGQVGNFSVAGHREPGIFWDMDKVQSGDDVVVETSTNWYVYQVFENHIVSPESVEVVAPVPNEPGVTATQPDLTLTTCNPRWDNYQRMAVHAKLVATYPHSQRPGELGGS